jgi:hypothetical protein
VINFLNCEKYTPSHYGNNINNILPNFLLIYENNIYKAILNHSKDRSYDSSILDYSKYNKIIDNIWDYLKIEKRELPDENNSELENNKPKKYTLSYLKDLKVENIKKLCIENNIELLKKSDKTHKMINKIKSDLIEDLLKL